MQDQAVQEKYVQVLNHSLKSLDIQNDNIISNWNTFTSRIIATTQDMLGFRTRRHRDWFDENDIELRSALEKHRLLLRQSDVDQIKSSTTELTESKDKRWQDRAHYMQMLSDSNQLREFFGEVRALIGPQHQISVPLRSSDGKLVSNRDEVLKCWADHFNALLNIDRPADLNYIKNPAWAPT